VNQQRVQGAWAAAAARLHHSVQDMRGERAQLVQAHESTPSGVHEAVVIDVLVSVEIDIGFHRCHVHTTQPIVVKGTYDATSHRSVFAGTLMRSKDGSHVEHLSERVEGSGIHDNNFT
jgi:hypothetical protein